jgi:hypothetical protein
MISDTSQPVSPPAPTVSDKAQQLVDDVRWAPNAAAELERRDVLLSYIATTETACNAWRDFAQHQEWCAVCADSVKECFDGSLLRDKANRADSAMESK